MWYITENQGSCFAKFPIAISQKLENLVLIFFSFYFMYIFLNFLFENDPVSLP